MFWFVLFCIFALLTIAYVFVRRTINERPPVEETRYGITAKTEQPKLPKWGIWLGLSLSVIALFFSTTYTQDPGEAKVLKSVTGDLVGADVTEGFAFKLPWVDPIDYDIRNQPATYIGNGQDDYNGKKPDGPQITVRDAKGVSTDVDVVVRYSIREDRVEDVYRAYGVQENFRSKLITNDIRSVVRNAPAKYTTIDMLNKRAEIEKEILADLELRWEKEGVRVDSVALQEMRPPADVSQAFAAAQNAQTQVVQAQAELDRTKISAQQKVVQAEAEAQANNTLNASLSDNILRQRYLDTLRELAAAGNLVVVPEGGNQILNVPAK